MDEETKVVADENVRQWLRGTFQRRDYSVFKPPITEVKKTVELSIQIEETPFETNKYLTKEMIICLSVSIFDIIFKCFEIF